MVQIANNNTMPHLRQVERITVRHPERSWIEPAVVFERREVETTNEFDAWYAEHAARSARYGHPEGFTVYSINRNLREETFCRELPNRFINPVQLASLITYELEVVGSRNRRLVHPGETEFYVSHGSFVQLVWRPRQHKLRLDLKPRAANRLCYKDTYLVVPDL